MIFKVFIFLNLDIINIMSHYFRKSIYLLAIIMDVDQTCITSVSILLWSGEWHWNLWNKYKWTIDRMCIYRSGTLAWYHKRYHVDAYAARNSLFFEIVSGRMKGDWPTLLCALTSWAETQTIEGQTKHYVRTAPEKSKVVLYRYKPSGIRFCWSPYIGGN